MPPTPESEVEPSPQSASVSPRSATHDSATQESESPRVVPIPDRGTPLLYYIILYKRDTDLFPVSVLSYLTLSDRSQCTQVPASVHYPFLYSLPVCSVTCLCLPPLPLSVMGPRLHYHSQCTQLPDPRPPPLPLSVYPVTCLRPATIVSPHQCTQLPASAVLPKYHPSQCAQSPDPQLCDM